MKNESIDIGELYSSILEENAPSNSDHAHRIVSSVIFALKELTKHVDDTYTIHIVEASIESLGEAEHLLKFNN